MFIYFVVVKKEMKGQAKTKKSDIIFDYRSYMEICFLVVYLTFICVLKYELGQLNKKATTTKI